MMKRRAFSILEVMIAFAIIAICGGALLMNFQKASKERQEKDVVDIIESKLKMAAHLARISDNEVRVIISEEDGVRKIFINSDINVSERMKANLSRKVPLAQVRDVKLSPDIGKVCAIAYYPWGIEDRQTQLQIMFTSGNQVICEAAKFVPNVTIDSPSVIDNIFPREILEDEEDEEKTQIHVN